MTTGYYLLIGTFVIALSFVALLFYWEAFLSNGEGEPLDDRTDEEKENDDKFGGQHDKLP